MKILRNEQLLLEVAVAVEEGNKKKKKKEKGGSTKKQVDQPLLTNCQHFHGFGLLQQCGVSLRLRI